MDAHLQHMLNLICLLQGSKGPSPVSVLLAMGWIKGPVSQAQLRYYLTGSPNTLTRSLRALQARGLVRRTMYRGECWLPTARGAAFLANSISPAELHAALRPGALDDYPAEPQPSRPGASDDDLSAASPHPVRRETSGRESSSPLVNASSRVDGGGRWKDSLPGQGPLLAIGGETSSFEAEKESLRPISVDKSSLRRLSDEAADEESSLQPDSVDKSSPGRLAAALDELDAWAIREPARSRLAVLPHVTLEYIRAHCLSSERAGLAIYRMRRGWRAPLNDLGHLLGCECARCR